jgi:hypothetical protein
MQASSKYRETEGITKTSNVDLPLRSGCGHFFSSRGNSGCVLFASLVSFRSSSIATPSRHAGIDGVFDTESGRPGETGHAAGIVLPRPSVIVGTGGHQPS